MDNLQSELAELKQFIAELKADRAAAKEKERREAWTKYVSLTVAIIAVIAAIASQRSGKYSGTVQMSQAQASDQWNFYEALSIKQHLFEINRDKAQSKADYDAKIADYEKKKADIKAKAEKLEKARDDASHMGSRVGPAVSCFTVSIAVASLCMITKKKPLWFMSLLLALVGILYWSGLVETLLAKGS